MNVRRLTPPLLIALAVSGLCTLVLSRKINVHAVEKVPLENYAAPVHAMAAGDVLRPENLHLVSWPATNPVPGAFPRIDAVLGRSLLYPVDADQPITEKAVSAAGAGVGLAGRIPDGMRAIALRSDEVMGVAGFLLPGSHLDVLVTYRTDKVPEPQTVTVLQDAEVLAAGHQIQPDPEGKPATVTVVTLLLSPVDAERAVLASTQGTIHFVLRSGSDKGRTQDSGIALSELGGRPRATPMLAVAGGSPDRMALSPRSLAAPPAPRKQQAVETISGDKQVVATFDEAIK